MALPQWFDDELYQKALRIVETAHGEGKAAGNVVYEALSKLDASTAAAERTLLDRIINRRQKTGLVLLGPPLFQRLLYRFSDLAARVEGSLECRQSDERMLARYIHVLLLYCLHRSSRWMAIGIAQFVFNYSGTELAEMTGQIAATDWHDSERRRAKGKLMDHLANRFIIPMDASVSAGKQFAAAPDQNRFIAPLNYDLTLCIPWETPHVLRSARDLKTGLPQALRERSGSPRESDLIELNRFHVFIDPICFNFLSEALGYGESRSKVRIPAICYSERDNRSNGDERPEVDGPGSMTQVRDRLKLDALRRSSFDKGDLWIYLDDRFLGTIDEPAGTIVCELPSDVDVISVCARDEDGEFLLASHILTHSDEGVALPSSGTVQVGKGHRLSFQVSASGNDPDGAICTVRHSRASLALFSFSTQRASRLALASTALLVAGIGVGIFYEKTRPVPDFPVIVGPQPIGARSVARDRTSAVEELISVPRGAPHIKFEVHPRNVQAGTYLVVLKVDAAAVQTLSTQSSADGALYFDLPAAKLKTGTYSIDISRLDANGQPGKVETHKFQMFVPDAQ